MTHDGIVTEAEVLAWLPDHIRAEWARMAREREMAMPPEERGWWTRAEMEADGGRFVETRRLCEAESRFYRTGD